MIRGLYSAAGGMQAMSQQQDSTAHNLSFAVKPGYRREVLQFDSVAAPSDLVGPRASMHTDFQPGVQEYTGSPLDVSLDGPGFFVIQGPNGPYYTRNGVFELNVQGQLVTPEGLAVQGGGGGPIALPLNATRVDILNDGTIAADGVVIDQLAVAAFPNPDDLERVSGSYFQAPPGMQTSPVATEFRQGYRELSNTTLVNEMVQMISSARLFEATQRALRQIGETIAYNTRPR